MDGLLATFGVNWKILLAQGFNFGLLLFLLWKFLYTPILKMVDDRKSMMMKGVEDAKKAAEKLFRAEKEGQDIVTKASQTAESLYETTRTRAEEKGASILEEARRRADSERVDTRARAEAEAKAIRKASEKEIARAAVLAAEKILKDARGA